MHRRLVKKIPAIAMYRLPTNKVFEQTPFPCPICFICLMLGDQGLQKVDLEVGGVSVVDCVRRRKWARRIGWLTVEKLVLKRVHYVDPASAILYITILGYLRVWPECAGNSS